jgi:hypothetical protein
MDNVDQKVSAIFQELVGERAQQLKVAVPTAQKVIAHALAAEGEQPDKVAHDIAFHLTDWNTDVGFIVAVLLYPERFTAEEIQSGVEKFIVHAPNHIAAAAKLSGYPVADIFEIGALDGETDD